MKRTEASAACLQAREPKGKCAHELNEFAVSTQVQVGLSDALFNLVDNTGERLSAERESGGY